MRGNLVEFLGKLTRGGEEFSSDVVRNWVRICREYHWIREKVLEESSLRCPKVPDCLEDGNERRTFRDPTLDGLNLTLDPAANNFPDLTRDFSCREIRVKKVRGRLRFEGRGPRDRRTAQCATNARVRARTHVTYPKLQLVFLRELP